MLLLLLLPLLCVLCDCAYVCLCVSLQGQSWWNKKLAYGMSQEISSSVVLKVWTQDLEVVRHAATMALQ